MATAPTRTRKPATRRTPIAAAVRAFKGLQDWIEVFRVGTHVDSKGREAAFSAEDLDQMAANVSGAGVPHVIGHPKEQDRAWAWCKPGDVKRDGDSLLVKASDVDPAFEQAVDAGAYRERSVSIYKDAQRGWVLQHVGWLGAVPPAIGGMQPLAYSAAAPAGADVHQFTADIEDLATGWALADTATLLRGLRDWLISKEGLDVANKVLPDWTINSVADGARRITDAALAEGEDDTGLAPMFNRGKPAGDPTMFTEADLQKARDEAAAKARKEAEDAAAQQFSAQGKELAELRAQRQTERIGVRINEWKAAGLLLPAEEPGLVEFMAALEGGQATEFTFSAADKTEAKKTPAQWFADFVAGRKAVQLGGNRELKKDGGQTLDTTDAQAIARSAQEYVHKEAQAGRTVSIAQAVVHVSNGGAV